MKNRGFLFIILIAVLLICPLAATGGAKVPDKNGNEVTKTNIQDDGDSILVLSSSTKKINEIDMFEYVVGAVAAEMPPTYHSQALRAQAAVCYTYAVKKRSSPDPALGGADITDDSAVHQGYLDAAARKEKWGDKYETYEKKIEEDVDDHLINKIAQYIREHLDEDISLNLLSDKFALNAQYISQLFKNQIGVNFLSYLTSIRMQKAKSLLLSSAKTIVEVSQAVGYNDYRVFTKVFKKHVGVSPSQYRKEFLSDCN